MSFPAATWTTGETPTAAKMNSQIRDNWDAAFPDNMAAVSWLPTLTATTSGSAAAESGRRYRIGPLMFVWARFVFTESSLGITGAFEVTLPTTASGVGVSTSSGTTIGSWSAHDNSTTANSQSGAVILSTSTVARFRLPVGLQVGGTVPFTWAVDDALTFHAVYPVA